MAKKQQKRATIIRVAVENFRRLRAAEVTLDGKAGLVRVTGKNQAGKTSLLKSIAAALGGQGEVEEGSIHDDAEGRANLRVVLSNGYTIQRKFTPSAPKGYLTITDPNGKTSSKQGLLNEFMGPHSFYPTALLTLDLEKQRKVLLGCGDDPDLGLKLDQLKVKQRQVYEERTPFISEQRRTSQVEQPAGLRPEAPDVSGDLAKLKELQSQADDRRELVHQLFRQDDLLASCQDAEKDAEHELAKLEEKLKEVREVLKERHEEVTTQREKRKALQLQVEQAPDPSEAIQEVQERLSEAEEVQEQLHEWKDWDRAQEQHREATKMVDKLTTQLKNLKAKEGQLIAEAGIPVKGLSFSEEGEPQLNGKPLSLASGGEKIEMAVSVALAYDPKVGVCLVDEANDLDLEHLEALDKLAQKHGFQVWACRLGLEGPGEILVEDGVATSRKED